MVSFYLYCYFSGWSKECKCSLFFLRDVASYVCAIRAVYHLSKDKHSDQECEQAPVSETQMSASSKKSLEN